MACRKHPCKALLAVCTTKWLFHERSEYSGCGYHKCLGQANFHPKNKNTLNCVSSQEFKFSLTKTTLQNMSIDPITKASPLESSQEASQTKNQFQNLMHECSCVKFCPHYHFSGLLQLILGNPSPGTPGPSSPGTPDIPATLVRWSREWTWSHRTSGCPRINCNRSLKAENT
jgi:hypothetical protein